MSGQQNHDCDFLLLVFGGEIEKINRSELILKIQKDPQGMSSSIGSTVDLRETEALSKDGTHSWGGQPLW